MKVVAKHKFKPTPVRVSVDAWAPLLDGKPRELTRRKDYGNDDSLRASLSKFAGDNGKKLVVEWTDVGAVVQLVAK